MTLTKECSIEDPSVIADSSITRRRILAATTSSVAFTPVLTACAEQDTLQNFQSAQTVAIPQSTRDSRGEKFNLNLPMFTVAERDRRWTAVRTNMARPNWKLDAIITAGSDQWANNARYLTQIAWLRYGPPGPELLFPADPTKPVTVHLNQARHTAHWERRLASTGWLDDGRLVLKPTIRAEAMADLLREEGFAAPGIRIGVAKLAGTRFDRDGLASYTYIKFLLDKLPGVEFLPIEEWGKDPGPIDAAAMTKSTEEITAMRYSVASSEACLANIIDAAKNRDAFTRQCDLWWDGFSTLYRTSGEDFLRLSVSLDENSNYTIGDPVADPVLTGQICNQEIAAAYQGYGVQINHAFFVGSPSDPGYDYYAACIETLLEMHERCIAFIQPGITTYSEFRRHNQKIADEMGVAARGLQSHGAGLGHLSRPSGGRNIEGNLVIQPGHIFDFKPAVRLPRETISDAHEENRLVQLGDAYLITNIGVERLGTRKMEPIATGKHAT